MAFNKEAARKAGYTEEEINTYLSSKKNTQTKTTSKGSTEPKWSDLIGNIPGSAVQTGKALIQPFLNPMDTIAGIGGLAGGAVQKFTPGVQEEEQLVDQLLGFYKDRYGGASNIKNTLIEDPVGAVSDASLLFTSGGAALKGAGAITKSNTLAKAGNIVSKVGEVTDPINAVSRVTKPATNAMQSVPGNIVDTYIPRPSTAEQVSETSRNLFKGEEKLGTKVADRTKLPIRVKKLAKLANEKATVTYEQIQENIKPFLDQDVNVENILEPKTADTNRLTITKLYDMIENSAIPNKQPILDDINEVVENIINKADNQGNVKLKELEKLRKNTDATLDKFFQNGKGINEVSPQEQISVVVSNELRNLINDAVPDLKTLNEEYGVWKDMERAAVRQTAKGTKWKPDAIDFSMGGLGVVTTGANPLSIFGPYITRRILSSSSTGLTAARLMQELLGLGEATGKVGGPASRSSYLLERPIEQGQIEN